MLVPPSYFIFKQKKPAQPHQSEDEDDDGFNGDALTQGSGPPPIPDQSFFWMTVPRKESTVAKGMAKVSSWFQNTMPESDFRVFFMTWDQTLHSVTSRGKRSSDNAFEDNGACSSKNLQR